MKIAIVGSRPKTLPTRHGTFTEATVRRHEAVKAYIKTLPPDSIIISGGARGVDTIAEVAAESLGLKTMIFPAEWQRYGKSAGHRRNALMVAAADKVVCFWDGRSRGTKGSID